MAVEIISFPNLNEKMCGREDRSRCLLIPKRHRYRAIAPGKINKKPFGLRTWKRQLMPRVLLELLLLASDVRNLKEVDLSTPTGAKREPYK